MSGDALLFSERREALTKRKVLDDTISDGNRGSNRISSVLRRIKKEDDGHVLGEIKD